MLQTAATTSFKLPGRQVVHEKIDDETIIVHLQNGYYYSLTDTGALIWDWMIEGRNVSEILQSANSHFDASEADLKQAILSFIDQLQEEQLVVGNAAAPRNAEIAPDQEQQRFSFEPPQLVKFTNLEGILDLDPVHEVDETGWPSKA